MDIKELKLGIIQAIKDIFSVIEKEKKENQQKETKFIPRENHFTKKELKCRCGKCKSKGIEMNQDFMNKINFLRELCDFPFVVTSAYRCKDHDDKYGGYRVHTTGKAIDIAVYHEQAHKLILNAGDMRCFTGFGISQKGDNATRFIHIDILNSNESPARPNIWSY